MMWKKKWVWIIVLLAAILGWNIYMRQPVPIARKDSPNQILLVMDYRQVDGEDVTGEIDEARLLELLESHNRKRGGFRRTNSSRDWKKIEIEVMDKKGPYYVVLGDWPIYYRPDGNKFYRVLDNDVLLEEITAMIDG